MGFSKALVPLLALSLVKLTIQAGPDDFIKHQADPDGFRKEQEPPDSFRMKQTQNRFYHEQDDNGRERERAYSIEGNDDFNIEQGRDYKLEDGDYKLDLEDGDYQLEDGDYREEDGNYEDDDDGDNLQSELRHILAKLQNEGHTKPPKLRGNAEEYTKPLKKVTFEDDTDTQAIVQRMMESKEDFGEGDGDDDVAMNQWVMVTAEGYEYEQTQDELELVTRESEAGTSLFSENTESYFGANMDSRLEASTNASIERIYGRDQRFRISNTRRYPWSAIGRVDTGCTGTFIGPRHVLTAGHCVYNPYTRRWRRNLNVRRAKNCYPNRGTFYRWKYAVTVHGWIKGRRDYNYAVIAVRTRSPTWMSFGWRSRMPRYFVNLPGYPWDKSRQCMWHSYCYLRGRYSRVLTHRCDTYHGMSGGPLYVKFRYYRVIYGVQIGSTRSNNLAIRINRRRYNTLRYIMRKYR